MKYIALIYVAEAEYAKMAPTDFGTLVADYQAFNPRGTS